MMRQVKSKVAAACAAAAKPVTAVEIKDSISAH